MKFAIRPEDKLALVISLVPHTVQGAERQDTRIETWDRLGVRSFARLFSQRLQKAVPGTPVSFSDEELKPFTGKKSVVVDLEAASVQFLIDEIGVGVPGIFQDQLTELRHELKALSDKKYELPKDLR